MSGSLLQLKYYGNDDQYLYSNPEISFFMSRYERPTRSAQELKSIELNGPKELSEDKTIIVSAVIPNDADIIGNVYFVFHLPDIYSSYNKNLSITESDKAAYKFQWIRSIGTNIIKNAKATLSGKPLSNITGEWIRIWHEIFSDVDRTTFDAMTGNLPRIFNPQADVQSCGIYPTSSLDPMYDNDPDIFSLSSFIKNPYKKGPSILGGKFIVPLNFFFSANHTGLFLPLIGLTYEELKIEIELRPLSELYTIIDNLDPSSDSYGQRIRPILSYPEHRIQNFITKVSKEVMIDGQNYSEINEKYTGFGFQPSLLVNYITLDKEERESFAKQSLNYMIEQSERIDFPGLEPGSTHTLQLRVQHPVKAIIYYATRDDLEQRNIFDIYVNHDYPPINPGSLSYIRQFIGESRTEILPSGDLEFVDVAEEARLNNMCMHKFNQTYFERSIIKSFKLILDGNERFSRENSDVFEYLQNYQHGVKTHIEGIQKYSFALNMTDYQHSSSCNMSSFKNIQSQIVLTDVPYVILSDGSRVKKYKFNVTFFIIKYNYFIVNNGQGALQFT